ncbi:TonB-dependent receptor [Flavobacteriales bacterium]|nr:TonB-dependent receptor [Flavobacteriales bacterium]
MKNIQHFVILLLVCLSQLSLANDSELRGTIIDDISTEPMFAANVGVVGSNIGASTDFDGNFELKIEPGVYTLWFTFIGYQTLQIHDVTVKANEVTNLGTIRLKSSAFAIDVVTITAETVKNSETVLLAIKKKSVNVIDGISSQNFKKMGDGNAAAAVVRVPGVSVQGGKYVYVRGLGDRYTKTTFNGLDIPGLDPDRNSLQVDIFPTNILDNIIVSKSFTADLPADFSGGVVDINIKSFPETKSLKGSTSISYNNNVDLNSNFLTYHGSESDWLGYDDGDRTFPLANTEMDIQNFQDPRINPETLPNTLLFNPQMGTVRGQNYFANNQFFKLYNNVSNNSALSFNGGSFSLSGGNQITLEDKTFGFSGAVSYKNKFSFYKDQIQNSFEKSSDPLDYDLFVSKTQQGDVGKNNALLSAMVGGAMKYKNAKYKVNVLHLQNAEKKAGLFFLNNYESNFNTVKKENLDFSERSISNLLLSGTHNLDEGKTKVEWKISPTYSKIRDKDVRESAYEVEIIDNDTVYYFSPSGAGYPSRMWRNLNEYNLASRIDVTKEHELYGRKAKIKYGTGYTYKLRDYDILRYIVYPINYGSNVYSGNPNELLSDYLYDINTNTGFYIGGEYQASNKYEGIQSNFSAYISEEVDFNDQLKGIFGLRLENYKQYYTGVNQDGSRLYDNELVLSDYTIISESDTISVGLYPSASIIFNIDKKSNLRGSVFRTTARPSFKEKSNAQILDVLSGVTFNGNIDLISTNIYNYDLRYETYYDDGQTIAISGFLKDLYNPIEIVAYSADEDNIQPINSGNARLMGVEFEARKKFEGVISGLSANVNASYIHSEVTIVGDEYESRQNNLRQGENFSDKREMQGQAPYLVNFGLSYKNKANKIDIGLFYNVQGPTLSIVGINNRPNIYSAPFNSLNLNVLCDINKKSKLTFSIKNILDEDRQMLTQSYGSDQLIYSAYSPGKSFSFKWSYNIF